MAKNAEELCKTAAEVLRRANKGEGVRQILYNVHLPPSTKPQLQAIVLGVQKDEALLWEVARESGIMSKVPPKMLLPDDKMLLVLLYEALLGSRRVRGVSELVGFIKEHKATLQQTLASLRKRGSAVGYADKIRLPRYARVNTLRSNLSTVLDHFRAQGWTVADSTSADQLADKSNRMNPGKNTILQDPVVPHLLAFPPGTSLHSDPLVASGAVILQDRSSCLSAQAVAPIPPGAIVADACAAPGNKTTHLTALLALADARSRKDQNGAEKDKKKKVKEDGGVQQGKVLAFERDKVREQVLRRQVSKLACGTRVEVHGMDFTAAAARAVKSAESCEAGSEGGNRHIDLTQTGESGAEEHDIGGNDLKALAAEQIKIVLAAMSLPKAQVVVYSTCSIHREENEDVVAAVAQNQHGFKLVRTLPDWPHRGLTAAGQVGDMCVRASYDKDDTNGFFVARFERSIGSGGADSKVADKATMNTTTPSTFSKSGKLSAKEASEGERSREQATKKDKHAIPKRVEQYVPAVAAQLSKRGAVQGDSDGGKKKRKKGAGESSLPPPKRSGLAKAAVDVD